tara:strand:- start:37 stop:354 length:318 start_codon:yes stop_codon:yes gene_type:complete
MIHKKIFFGFIIINFLSACSSPTAFLGPAYTLTSTGNIYQASFTYGSGELITKRTGKSPLKNLQDLTQSKKEVNIQKQTLESENFSKLVKKNIKKTRSIIKYSNQ